MVKKYSYIKWVIFQNHIPIAKIKWTCLIIQQIWLKNAAGVDTSEFAKRTDLVNLKSAVDKLGIGKLKNVPQVIKVICKVK